MKCCYNKKSKNRRHTSFFPHNSCLMSTKLFFSLQDKRLTQKFNFICILTRTTTSLPTGSFHDYRHTTNLVSILIISQTTFFYNDLLLRYTFSPRYCVLLIEKRKKPNWLSWTTAMQQLTVEKIQVKNMRFTVNKNISTSHQFIYNVVEVISDCFSWRGTEMLISTF